MRGNGAAALYNLMEDAATAEISRSQVWHWVRSTRGVLDDGRKVTLKLRIEFPHPSQFQHLPEKCNPSPRVNCRN